MPVSPDVSDFRSYVIGLSAPVNSAGECASQAPMKEQVKYTSFPSRVEQKWGIPAETKVGNLCSTRGSGPNSGL
jgi:hypothetical protein